MTKELIESALEEIRKAASGDYEAAHGWEDRLFLEFIEHVAESGPEDLAEMARLVLTSGEIEFARHCA